MAWTLLVGAVVYIALGSIAAGSTTTKKGGDGDGGGGGGGGVSAADHERVRQEMQEATRGAEALQARLRGVEGELRGAQQALAQQQQQQGSGSATAGAGLEQLEQQLAEAQKIGQDWEAYCQQLTAERDGSFAQLAAFQTEVEQKTASVRSCRRVMMGCCFGEVLFDPAFEWRVHPKRA
jgi:hypothetical protein